MERLPMVGANARAEWVECGVCVLHQNETSTKVHQLLLICVWPWRHLSLTQSVIDANDTLNAAAEWSNERTSNERAKKYGTSRNEGLASGSTTPKHRKYINPKAIYVFGFFASLLYSFLPFSAPFRNVSGECLTHTCIVWMKLCKSIAPQIEKFLSAFAKAPFRSDGDADGCHTQPSLTVSFRRPLMRLPFLSYASMRPLRVNDVVKETVMNAQTRRKW